ncbi:MAG: hypothetical protein A2820_02175 [Candidatus Buchananbacteria bacterium RIFCSPHIGHO2_01_FULL_40_35]|nr:MAG: hypothetical protein A2820_02175 [Candidatus Buchananbacteria bacterium RIFCSPHIGHO2_01_FULL_40_35]
MENLLAAWREFLRGKRHRQDVALFSLHLTDNILLLQRELANRTYRHGPYRAFKINDPKPRHIHKASVRDRLVHHVIYRVLYPYFDSKFIFDSFSCRRGKGTHRAMNRFQQYGRQVSRNNTRTAWILKGDIRKFFASIDHKILRDILSRQIRDNDVVRLLGEVIGSFQTKDKPNIGLPLGNLTSQLLVNIYLNEFDYFIKRKLKIAYYVRYADDFVIISDDKRWLANQIRPISDFLFNNLQLQLHSDKVFIKSLASGVDFLGWVHFPRHRVLRTATKRRMLKRIIENPKPESVNLYLGLISHGNSYKLRERIANLCDFC